MSPTIAFADAAAASDALTFAGRAERMGHAGVRLFAEGGILSMSTAILAPHGLLDDTPTILAMRMFAVDPELTCDVVVSTLVPTPNDAVALTLPQSALAPAWAGIRPPRSAWETVGAVEAAELASIARAGVSRVADALPASPGAEVVQTVRSSVWGESSGDMLGLPRGVALAADGMGFISGSERAVVWRSGRWMRISLARGHVVVRRSANSADAGAP